MEIGRTVELLKRSTKPPPFTHAYEEAEEAARMAVDLIEAIEKLGIRGHFCEVCTHTIRQDGKLVGLSCPANCKGLSEFKLRR